MTFCQECEKTTKHELNLDQELSVLFFADKGDALMVGGNLKVYREEDFSLLSLPRQEVDYDYMCSDGFQYQFGGLHNNKYMKKQLRKLLIQLASPNSQEKKVAITREFDDWKGNRRQLDDVLVMGFDPR